MGSNATDQTHSNSENEKPYLKERAKSILLLATLVATATYAAGFSPPGGVWQETAGHLPGDPIIMSTQYVRYFMFFYCNAAAFASSFTVVAVLILLLAQRKEKLRSIPRSIIIPLVLVTLLGLLGLIGAYAAGTFRDVFTAVFTSLLVAAVFTYIAVEKVLLTYKGSNSNSNSNEAASSPNDPDVVEASSLVVVERYNRKVLMQLATFALTITYGSGLSTPGGFWDSTDGGNRPGDAILKGPSQTVFFVCNTMAFMASLLMVLVLLMRKSRRMMAVHAGSIVLLFGLLGSYLAGNCRENDTAIYMASFIGAFVAYIIFVAIAKRILRRACSRFIYTILHAVVSRLNLRIQTDPGNETMDEAIRNMEPDKKLTHSTYVQYLATLALTITYVAGLHPPGGLWQDDGDGHKAGDPILQTTNLRRYNAFFYCNSVAFVASLVCMILVPLRYLLHHRALEQAMILDLLGLVGSYAFGSCRAGTTTVYTAGIGGAALVYVVLHVILMDKDTHGGRKEDEGHRQTLDRMGYGFFVFAIFVATITYQAGLTPPGGFLLKDDESGNHAGDPVLLHNYPRRYRVFFYCNSTSFMVSIAIIILLVNPKLYRPAIQTHALSVCTAVSFFCLLAAFAAGTTQHLKTSIYTLLLLAVAVFCSAVFLIMLLRSSTPTGSERKDLTQEVQQLVSKRLISMMTVGILVASVTYQAGLDPPGGSWPRSSDGHDAGSPVMHNNRRQRYLLFFLSNSASFVSSIFLMLLLLPCMDMLKKRLPMFRKAILLLGFLGLLGAYATGSNREWKTSVYVIAIFFSVLVYFSFLLVLSLIISIRHQLAEPTRHAVRAHDDML